MDDVDSSQEAKHCKHGAYNHVTAKCECFPGWATAGPTDPINYAEGVCEQFMCQSDAQCQQLLGIPSATCPIKSWNCYCGWQYAYQNMGHGYETLKKRGGAECMGIMYAFSAWTALSTLSVMTAVWKIVLVLAFLLLPFGRKRCTCDHHCISLWNYIRGLINCRKVCSGECVTRDHYTWETLMDDMAWSLYALEVGVWFYFFLAVFWAIVMFIWSAILWAVAIITLICFLLMGLCAVAGEGGGCSLEGCGCCEALACGHCGECGWAGLEANNYEVFYWGGVHPVDPVWSNTRNGSNVRSCPCLCKPLGWLIYFFPVMPENAWGGFCGMFIFHTHTFSDADAAYSGGSDMIDWFQMSWRRQSDLHGNDSWRRQVRDFLTGAIQQNTESAGNGRRAPQQQRQQQQQSRTDEEVRQWAFQRDIELGMNDRSSAASDTSNEVGSLLHSQSGVFETLRVGGALVRRMRRPFHQETDRCVESSFSDYIDNKCWICMDSRGEWDLWLSCKHMFCRVCSTEMLQRRMPCPLCRVGSSTVLRGTHHSHASPL
eukprot:TRINITY_DN5283_c1_g1_i2.p1 TRINITY_DN5283_c1_g1~~TRINITY_DN5283_c1_g1_i2.p1  ORF type:complete len:596 (+),score=46.27 TRINITY_DN5283_c1_g1_i2:160-1788(+)